MIIEVYYNHFRFFCKDFFTFLLVKSKKCILYWKILFFSMFYTVTQSRELSGSIQVSGSKNAALPLLAASVLMRGKVILKNVPHIGDVYTFLKILSSL